MMKSTIEIDHFKKLLHRFSRGLLEPAVLRGNILNLHKESSHILKEHA